MYWRTLAIKVTTLRFVARFGIIWKAEVSGWDCLVARRVRNCGHSFPAPIFPGYQVGGCDSTTIKRRLYHLRLDRASKSQPERGAPDLTFRKDAQSWVRGCAAIAREIATLERRRLFGAGAPQATPSSLGNSTQEQVARHCATQRDPPMRSIKSFLADKKKLACADLGDIPGLSCISQGASSSIGGLGPAKPTYEVRTLPKTLLLLRHGKTTNARRNLELTSSIHFCRAIALGFQWLCFQHIADLTSALLVESVFNVYNATSFGVI